MKFDVIVVNPPYQDKKQVNIGGGSNKKLWIEFFKRSIEFLNDDGKLGIIIPYSWSANKNVPHGNYSLFEKYIKTFNTTHINYTPEIQKMFGVGIQICYLIIEKSSYKNITLINNYIEINLNKYEYLPVPLNRITLSLVDTLNKFEKFNFEFVRATDGIEKHDIKSKENCFKTYLGKNGIKYINVKTKYSDDKKAIIYRMGNAVVFSDNLGEISPVYSNVLLLDKNENADNLKHLFVTKLYKYLLSSFRKLNQYNDNKILNYLPKINLDQVWTDKELYKHFKLTQEEIDLIENENFK